MGKPLGVDIIEEGIESLIAKIRRNLFLARTIEEKESLEGAIGRIREEGQALIDAVYILEYSIRDAKHKAKDVNSANHP